MAAMSFAKTPGRNRLGGSGRRKVDSPKKPVPSVVTRAPAILTAKRGTAPSVQPVARPVTRQTVARVLRILRNAAPQWNAPVLTLMAVEKRDPFLTLIGCILSLRTRDEATAVAAPRLFERADTPSRMLELTPAEIECLIYPVGFYRTKARVIHQICHELIERFGGRVPERIEDLLSLKGVGRKTANLVITQAFGKPGICVDTHVHRISNRWGLVHTRSPSESEQALREVLPRRYWIEYNSLLVAFGQTLCQPVSPWCSRCPINHLCPRIGVVRCR